MIPGALRAASRRLRRSARFTLGFSLVLGVGIGGVLFVVALLQATVFRVLPWPAPEQLHALMSRDNGVPRQWTSAEATAASRRGLPGVAFTWYSTFDEDLGDVDIGLRVRTALVESHFFRTLGLTVSAGRVPDAADAPDAIVLSSALAARLYADAPAIGTRVRVGGRLYTVAGVLPPGGAFPLGTDLWRIEGASASQAEGRAVDVIVRDSTGRPADALASLLTGATTPDRGPSADPGVHTTVSATPLTEHFRPRLGRRGRVILAGIGAVVVLVLINLSNAMMLRAQRTQFGNAIRVTLGAPYSRLAREAVLEVVLLVAMGLALGVGLGSALTSLVRAALGGTFEAAPLVLGGAWALVLFAALLVIVGALAIAPILTLSRVAPTAALRLSAPSGAPEASRLRRTFLGLQVGASTLFVLVAASIGATFVQVSQLDLGFDHERLGFATIGLRAEEFGDPARVRAVAHEAAARARVSLGVPSVAVWGTTYPYRFARQTESSIQVPGRDLPAQDPRVLPILSLDVNADYFDVLGIAVREGRRFDSRDVEGSSAVVILDEIAARTLFGEGQAIGKSLRLGGRESTFPWMTVVGVVASSQPIHPLALDFELAGTRHPLMYRPLAQAAPTALLAPLSDPGFSIAVGLGESPDRASQALARLFADLVPQERPAFMGTVSAFVDRAGRLEEARLEAVIFGVFGIVGVLLAILGVATAVDHASHARTREVGIRLALGAPAHAIRRLVCGGVLRAAAIGIATAVAAFVLGNQAVRSLLRESWTPGNSPIDIQWPFVFVAAGAAVVLVTGIAIWRAGRALSVDPAEALRAE